MPLLATNTLSPRERIAGVLTGLARGAIAQALGHGALPEVREPWLLKTRASFVTLKCNGELRGCIGSLTAQQALRDDVIGNARNAAFKDPRFAPVAAHELPDLNVEVSLLTPPSAMEFRDQGHALEQLRPFLDGVILHYRQHRGTFLPQVWENLTEPGEFMRHLKIKAGLPADFWAEDLRLYRYRASKFYEPESEAPS